MPSEDHTDLIELRSILEAEERREEGHWGPSPIPDVLRVSREIDILRDGMLSALGVPHRVLQGMEYPKQVWEVLGLPDPRLTHEELLPLRTKYPEDKESIIPGPQRLVEID